MLTVSGGSMCELVQETQAVGRAVVGGSTSAYIWNVFLFFFVFLVFRLPPDPATMYSSSAGGSSSVSNISYPLWRDFLMNVEKNKNNRS